MPTLHLFALPYMQWQKLRKSGYLHENKYDKKEFFSPSCLHTVEVTGSNPVSPIPPYPFNLNKIKSFFDFPYYALLCGFLGYFRESYAHFMHT
jgi:hypothetical protein